MNKLKKKLTQSSFFSTLLVLALPIMLQNILTSTLNMADTLMVGSMGANQVAAVGIGNQFSFLFNLVVFGIMGGCSIFISQYWGKRDIENIKKVVGLGGSSVIMIGLISMLIALIAPDAIVGIFTKDPLVTREASSYLKIVCFSYIATAVTFTLSNTLRCIEDAKTPMVISAIAIIINIILNYILIFGKLGLPSLGVKGAALATVIARFIEFGLILIISNKNCVIHGKIKEFLDFDKSFATVIYKSIVPVVINEACWGLGVFVYAIAYGKLGTEAMAAVQITNNIQNLFLVFAFSMGSASLVMIGNQIGSGDEETSKKYALNFTFLSFSVGAILGLSMMLSSEAILSMFNVSDTVKQYSSDILKVYAVAYPFKSVNLVHIVGVFRGGGDTNFALKAEIFPMWLIGVPMAFIGAITLNLPIPLVVLLVSLEELAKFIICISRFISYKWVNNVIECELT